MAAKSPDSVLLATIGKPKGVRGQVWAYAHTADPKSVLAYGPLFCDRLGKKIAVRGFEVKGAQIVLALDGIADRTAVEALRGANLYAERSQLPALPDDQFYVLDLLGCAAMAAGKKIGEVVEIYNHGAGDVIDIKLTADGEIISLPFHRDFFGAVDLIARSVEVFMPEFLEASTE
jgi:16S rRNA processing protein RimM